MCFKNRKTLACIVTVFSILIALGGVVLLIESIVFETKGSLVTANLGSITSSVAMFRNGTFIAMLVASIVAILLGILGSLCLLKFCERNSCCLSVGYGTIMFFVWIIFIVVGAILTAFAFLSPDQVQSLCKVGTGNSRVAFIGDAVQSLDKTLNSVVNAQMCSQYCVCPTNATGVWLSKSESYVNGFGRSLKPASQFNATDKAANYTSIVTSNTGSLYTKYTDCASNATDVSNNSALKLVQYFEQKYACSGIC